MENKDIIIKSTVRATVELMAPAINLRRTWSRRNAIQRVPYDQLVQAYYEPGVEYLFKAGILYIEDQETRIALGLEEPETKVGVKSMSDAEMENLLLKMPISEFKEEIEKYTHDQLIEIAQLAVDKKIVDFHRCKILKEKTELDVLAIVQQKIADEEAEANK